MLLWDPAALETDRPSCATTTARCERWRPMGDGRAVSADADRRVLVLDPGAPETGPADLGRYHSPVRALGVLGNTRVVAAAPTGACWC